MDPILIIKNIDREGPGLIESCIRERGLAYRVVDVSAGQTPDGLETAAALFILGGPASVNDQTPEIRKVLAAATTALEQDIPTLGVCLGLQMLVRAAGGRVLRSALREIGFVDPVGEHFTVELTKDGEEDPIFSGIGASFPVFQLHGETVELAAGMRLIGSGRHCTNQAVRVAPRAYGFQFHIELTRDLLELWCREDGDLSRLDSASILADYDAAQPGFENRGRRILDNFLDFVAATRQ